MRYSWPWGVSPAYSAGAQPLPRISIVTPNYNGAQFLEATIRSVICQGYPNLQYIIADGASTDGSLEIIDRYREHIAVVISEPDRGHGDALNKGFAKADGEILAWLNSDDMYLPWALHTVAEIFTAFPDVRWIEGLQSLWDDVGRLHGTHSTPPVNQYDYLLGRYEWIQQESVFWTRGLWEDAGARIADDYKLMIDGELWARFFLHAPLYRVDYALSGFRMHTTNRSHDKALLHEEMKRAIEKMRTQVAPEVASTVQRFTSMRKWLEPIPSLTLRSGIARKVARSQLEAMGYDVIWRDKSTYKIKRIPFSYSRLYSW